MKQVYRFLHDWRVDVEVKELPPHVDLDRNIGYRLIATWQKNDEVIELAKKALAEAAKYHNIEVGCKKLYFETGRIDLNVSGIVLKELGF